MVQTFIWAYKSGTMSTLMLHTNAFLLALAQQGAQAKDILYAGAAGAGDQFSVCVVYEASVEVTENQ